MCIFLQISNFIQDYLDQNNYILHNLLSKRFCWSI